jgi:non-heme chloroperoxidase
VRRVITVVAISLAILIFVIGSGIAYLLIFGTATSPRPLASVVDPFASIDYAGLPACERYSARDEASLAYRTYSADEQLIVLLIHGSAGSSSSMHAMAKALQGAGITVYVPDLRGHGDNQPHGDVAYIGQLDDDLADFVSAIASAPSQGEMGSSRILVRRRLCVGHRGGPAWPIFPTLPAAGSFS